MPAIPRLFGYSDLTQTICAIAQDDRDDQVFLVRQMAVEEACHTDKAHPKALDLDTRRRGRVDAREDTIRLVGKDRKMPVDRMMVTIQDLESTLQTVIERQKTREIVRILDLVMTVKILQKMASKTGKPCPIAPQFNVTIQRRFGILRQPRK